METLCERDFTISRVNAHAQYWRDGESFLQYMTTPRSEHGIMLLSGCDARFVLKDGGEIEAKRGAMLYLPGMRSTSASATTCGSGACW